MWHACPLEVTQSGSGAILYCTKLATGQVESALPPLWSDREPTVYTRTQPEMSFCPL